MGMCRVGGIILLAVAYACGGRGGDGGFGGLTGNLLLLDHSPKDSEIQVEQDTSIVLRFDAIVVPECLRDPDTWLGVGDSTEAIPGTFVQEDGGREVVFTPESPLDPELDYTFHLSALTCDTSGRILETALSFTFRSLDERSPWVSGSSAPNGGDGVSRNA